DDLGQKMEMQYIIDSLKDGKKHVLTFPTVVDGVSKHKKLTYSYLNEEDKEHVLFCIRDISEAYNKERTALSKVEKALEDVRAANVAKTEFFSRMSHDMRTPMNGILGITELSKDVTDIDELQNNMDEIRNSGEFLLGLINDTLDFQKIESGKLKLEPSVVNAASVLNSIISMIKNDAVKKKINFIVEDSDINIDCNIKADSVRLKQIFLNLLSNSIKFTPEGGFVELIIRCDRRCDTKSHLIINVIDTGLGMSEKFLQDGVFTPFAQEENEVTYKYPGTGLGLSIVKQLVELMGGTISVESELGVGTKFTVELDIEKVDEKTTTTTTLLQNKEQIEIEKNLNSKKILLAEDHPLNARIAIKLLEKEGCNVEWVKNGQECVDVFANSKPEDFDMILMDIRMPELNGLEAAIAIRHLSNANARMIPILAMTANVYDDDIKQSYEAGMNGHISKPLQPQIMFKTMAEAFNS
ncbi:MAG: response regulator, partial [Clostridiales bacterium]|nr:response regulator [Clostridiales bacterium]